jgi:hypothetical protein
VIDHGSEETLHEGFDEIALAREVVGQVRLAQACLAGYAGLGQSPRAFPGEHADGGLEEDFTVVL